MISHALNIVINELRTHLAAVYNPSNTTNGTTTETPILTTTPVVATRVELGNLAEGFGDNKPLVPRDILNFSVVNIKEEKALKNLANVVRNEVTLTTSYQNPPVFLNFQILVTATHTDYSNALVVLSRVIRFFQFKNVFTQDNVAQSSLTFSGNPLDQLESFKLIFDLYSPSMEEVNHLWGTLGGKQYPSVIYMIRMLDLQYMSTQSQGGLITEVISDFHHKKPVEKL